MPGISPEIEVYPVQHLPIIKAYADQLGLVSLINHYVPTEMDVDAGTIVLGLVLDTLSGRSPLYRLEEFFAHQDTELLLGKALPPHAFTDDTVGRVLDRLYDFGTMRLFTACAVRAVMRFDLERRYVHFDTTSRSVWGAYQFAETQDLPFQVTYGYSKDKRPDLKQFILSTLCVDRAVPIWGKLDDGNASDKTLNTTLLSEIAQLMAHHGVQPDAYIYIADAALVTEDNLAALGDTLFITRLPATYSECERVIGEAVARNRWEEVGVLAQTPSTRHRPGTFYKVAEDMVTLYGKPYRAVVVHSRRGNSVWHRPRALPERGAPGGRRLAVRTGPPETRPQVLSRKKPSPAVYPDARLPLNWATGRFMKYPGYESYYTSSCVVYPAPGALCAPPGSGARRWVTLGAPGGTLPRRSRTNAV